MEADPEVYVTAGRHCILFDVATGLGRVELVDESRKQIRATKKSVIPVSTLIGLPFGSTLVLSADRTWRRTRRVHGLDLVKAVLDDQQDTLLDPAELSGADQAQDSRPKRSRQDYLVDDNKGQALGEEEVLALKTSGIDHVSLISSIVSGNQNFENRSEFSKEKYILRKYDRHVSQLTVLKCTTYNLTRIYGSQPQKMGGMRPDYLGVMMNEANVCAGKDVMVFDHSLGLITLNVLRRLGGDGRCYFLSEKKGTGLHVISQADLPEEELAPLTQIPHNLVHDAVTNDFDPAALAEKHDWLKLVTPLDYVENIEKLADTEKQSIQGAVERRKVRHQLKLTAFNHLKSEGVHCFVGSIDASRLDSNNPILTANLLSEVYQIMEKLVVGGGRVAIFCTHFNPLSDLYGYMKSLKDTWTNLRFEEYMLRNFSALPSRSHPVMKANMKLFEGFILTGSRMSTTEVDGLVT